MHRRRRPANSAAQRTAGCSACEGKWVQPFPRARARLATAGRMLAHRSGFDAQPRPARAVRGRLALEQFAVRRQRIHREHALVQQFQPMRRMELARPHADAGGGHEEAVDAGARAVPSRRRRARSCGPMSMRSCRRARHVPNRLLLPSRFSAHGKDSPPTDALDLRCARHPLAHPTRRTCGSSGRHPSWQASRCQSARCSATASQPC